MLPVDRDMIGAGRDADRAARASETKRLRSGTPSITERLSAFLAAQCLVIVR